MVLPMKSAKEFVLDIGMDEVKLEPERGDTQKRIQDEGVGHGEMFLGINIDHEKNAGAIMINKTRYIDEVVERFNQQIAKIV